MPEKGVRSTYSQCPFQLLMYENDVVISTGTGFFYAQHQKEYIITNWHNVTGIDPYTGNLLDSKHRRPTRIVAKLSQWINNLDPRLFALIGLEVPIYSDDLQQTRWFEHPTLGPKCDVVAIPFARPDNMPPFMHNRPDKISTIRIPVEPGNQVFIIGFPSGLSIGFGLPLWKSGYIASEPHYDVTLFGKVRDGGGLEGGISIPAFFLDAATRRGMSGSPVFARYFGKWDMSDPYAEVDPASSNFWSRKDIALGESAMEFVGVYSGRVPAAENEAALGICWKIQAIDDICDRRHLGTHPHT
ncbi:serine protease [Aquibium sp. LZ166]|uniref:Serine protease n=1 Tax=Aquibium pacificus TaxID=3153579 RepID=A0ABV3SFH9_9HYPH